MIRSAIALLLASGLACVSSAQTRANANAPAVDKAGAYYNFAMGRLYAELAGSEGGRNDYVSKAIQHYLDALKQDPAAGMILEELTDLYIQSGRLRDAVTQAEDLLAQNPDNLEARRMLGRIYTRMIGDTQQGRINQDMLRRATEQYQKITEKDPKDVESWVTLGRLYRVSNNSTDAEKAYNAALKVEPENEDALTGLAILYSELGDTQRAIDKLKTVTDKNPSENTLVALASAYEQVKDFKSAVDVLNRALNGGADNVRVRKMLAQDLYFSGQNDAALKLYQQLAAEDPKDSGMPLRISEIYRATRDFAKSHEALDKAKQLEPDSIEVLYAEVNLLEAEGKTSQAISNLKNLVQSTARKNYSRTESASHAMLLERLGTLYRDNGQYNDAVESFRQIAALDTDSAPRAAVQIVTTYQTAKDYDNASREADAAYKKFPKDRMVVFTHASLLAELGKTEEALSETKGMLKGQPDLETLVSAARVYDKAKRYSDEAKVLDEADKLAMSREEKEDIAFMRGAMFERSKKYEASEAEFRKVLGMNPNNAGALNYLGYMLANRGQKLEEASQLIAKALQIEPDNAAYLDSLGWAYYQQGKLTEAEAPLLRAIEKMGEDPTVHDHLGDLYLKQGKTKEAIAQWQTSLQRYRTGAPSDIDTEDIGKINKKLENARVRLAKETNQ
ncbi:MAG TPA: tetratricopeptide repeat protein [Bryobacteraceae bacterium]|jgi:tetratricopeptide (TPR) repeat protein|nr:tetratricopeptide repeat protein [Bryobacteraceae bacterium]